MRGHCDRRSSGCGSGPMRHHRRGHHCHGHDHHGHGHGPHGHGHHGHGPHGHGPHGHGPHGHGPHGHGPHGHGPHGHGPHGHGPHISGPCHLFGPHHHGFGHHHWHRFERHHGPWFGHDPRHTFFGGFPFGMTEERNRCGRSPSPARDNRPCCCKDKNQDTSAPLQRKTIVLEPRCYSV